MTRRMLVATIACILGPVLKAQQKQYSGPWPAKKGVPYLAHGDKLIETEAVQASQSNSKEGMVFSVPGATSPARTPLAEPIFLFATERFRAEQLGLYRFEVKNGARQVALSSKRRKADAGKQYHLTIRKLDDGLYRLEASETLDPGEYALSPEGDNTAFCFTVF